MYIAMIVVGVALVVIGIVGIANKPAETDDATFESTESAFVSDVPAEIDIPAPQYPKDERLPASDAKEKTTPSDNHPPQPQKTQDEINKEKGNAFEGFVADCFADRDVFKVLAWNQGVTSPAGVYAENDTDPDFHIKQRFSPNFDCEYYVEAKYCGRWSNASTITLQVYQLQRYREFQDSKHRKVLLAIGIGGQAGNPAEFYLIPLDSVAQPKLSAVDLAPFKLVNPHKNFRKHVYNYFQNEVFAASRKKKNKTH